MKKALIFLFLWLPILFLGSCKSDMDVSPEIMPDIVKYRDQQEMIEQSIAAYNHLYPTKSRSSRQVANVVPVRMTPSRGELPNPLYAINFEDSAGYVIMASNPNVEPVMAVIEEGSFDPNNENEGFNCFLKTAENYAPTISNKDLEIGIDTLRLDFTYWEEDVDTLVYLKVKPHLDTWWGQKEPYNKYCPVSFDKETNSYKNCLTGCVPTALSMIMAYFQNSLFFKITFDGSNRNVRLNWSEIKRHKYTPASNIGSDNFLCTETGHNQLALIMRELGHICGTQYGLGISTTAADMIPKGLDAIGIKDVQSKNYYTINGIIDNGTLLLMYGNGHCFIIDGADCIWFKYTLRLYRENGLGIRKLISTEYSESMYNYAHVVWGYDNLAVGYFNDNILAMMKPVRLDAGAYSSDDSQNFYYGLKYYPLKLTFTLTPLDPVPVH